MLLITAKYFGLHPPESILLMHEEVQKKNTLYIGDDLIKYAYWNIIDSKLWLR